MVSFRLFRGRCGSHHSRVPVTTGPTAATAAASTPLELEHWQLLLLSCISSSISSMTMLALSTLTLCRPHSAVGRVLVSCPAVRHKWGPATPCVLLGPRVWGYGAPVGALPSMGRCVFGSCGTALVLCGEALLGVGPLLAAPSFPCSCCQPLQPFDTRCPPFWCVVYSLNGPAKDCPSAPSVVLQRSTLSIRLLLFPWGPSRRMSLVYPVTHLLLLLLR